VRLAVERACQDHGLQVAARAAKDATGARYVSIWRLLAQVRHRVGIAITANGRTTEV